jgi:ribosomal protein S18 acetylase RimI-like enzyme
MGLLPDYRGLGLGSRLMEITVEAARALGLEKVELVVYASNRSAINLYRKFGFEVEGRQRRKRKIDGVYDDQILMGLFLLGEDALSS